MPPVEETLASYLSVGETSSLKAPSLPSKPLQKYAAAGQAVASLHTMAVLQAYQADLLKDLDKGQGLSPDEVAELMYFVFTVKTVVEKFREAKARSSSFKNLHSKKVQVWARTMQGSWPISVWGSEMGTEG